VINGEKVRKMDKTSLRNLLIAITITIVVVLVALALAYYLVNTGTKECRTFYERLGYKFGWYVKSYWTASCWCMKNGEPIRVW
jgi:hypothetical protein